MKKWFKECPFCANEIKEKAVKCQYCWEFLPKEEHKKEELKKKTKECPFCMNKVDIDVTVCPFCDENIIENNAWKENPKKSQEIISNKTSNNELTKANNNIKTAFIFWCIWAWITLIMSLAQQNWELLFWLIYILVLLYFLYYKKNRMAALFLFIEYIIDTIYSFVNWWATWILGILILIWFFMGIKGTFSYHKIIWETKLSTTDVILIIVGWIVTLLEIIGLFAS